MNRIAILLPFLAAVACGQGADGPGPIRLGDDAAAGKESDGGSPGAPAADTRVVELAGGVGRAAANVSAMQAAFDLGGKILVRGAAGVSGDVYINATVYYDDDSDIEFDASITLCRTGSFGEMLLNRSALQDGEADSNIRIRGLRLDPKGSGTRNANVLGMNGHFGAFRVKDLTLEDFHLTNGGATMFSVHVCDFEDVTIRRPHINSEKDGIHVGCGERLTIESPFTRSSDDGIALNAMDWIVSNPSFGRGYLRDVRITDWHDQGFDAGAANAMRIIHGAWGDWDDIKGTTVTRGMQFRGANGWVYRSVLPPGRSATASSEPAHTGWRPEGNIVTGADGIPWIAWQRADFDAVSVEDIRIDRLVTNAADGDSGRLAMFSLDGDKTTSHLTAVHPGYEAASSIQGLVICNWHHTGTRASQTIIGANATVTGVTIRDSRFSGVDPINFIATSEYNNGGSPSGVPLDILLDNVHIDYEPGSLIRNQMTGLDIRARVLGGKLGGGDPKLTVTAGTVALDLDPGGRRRGLPGGSPGPADR